jgi:hypothetical protein
MATIRRRKSRWQVQIRRQGHQLSRTFRLRADAELWARQLKAELDRGGPPVDNRTLRSHTLADLLRRYVAEVVPRKRSADREVYMLRVILRHPIARVSLHLLTAQHDCSRGCEPETTGAARQEALVCRSALCRKRLRDREGEDHLSIMFVV